MRTMKVALSAIPLSVALLLSFAHQAVAESAAALVIAGHLLAFSIALKMQGAWTYGILANHVWSFAGSDNRPNINNTFLQPFVARTWPSAWTLSFQSETSYNWETEKWTVPVNVAVAKLTTFGRLPVSLQAGVGYWFESPAGAADDWRLRFQANFVLPR